MISLLVIKTEWLNLSKGMTHKQLKMINYIVPGINTCIINFNNLNIKPYTVILKMS